MFGVLFFSILSFQGIVTSSGKTYKDLNVAIEKSKDGDTLWIGVGTFEAVPHFYRDSICGNCIDPHEGADATYGFLVSGKSLHLIGSGPDRTTLVTRAGYGVLFLDSWGSLISDLKVTGGLRDPDGKATDAAIVVKRSKVYIRNVLIEGNRDVIDSIVVGIGGVFGREGSEVLIERCRIVNNSWDGIALYRGSVAYISDNVIEEGRGAGIGITWDATAIVLRNKISKYWKGIGTFGRSKAIIKNNIIRDCLGWGLIATGESSLEASFNTIYRNGNCGFATWSDSVRGMLENSVIVGNGWKKMWVCPGVGIWMNAPPKKFALRYNDVWGNKAGNYEGVEDLTGKLGNLSIDPDLDTLTLIPNPNSPLIDRGDPFYLDRDGSRADIGYTGGPNSPNGHVKNER